MGGDGGSLVGRDVMVKTKQRTKVEVDPFFVTHEQLTHCAVSGAELSRPIVACELGYLYNKDAILSHLLSKHDNPKLRHIRGMKDLIDCKIVLSTDKRPASAAHIPHGSLDTASVTDSQRRAMEGAPPPTLVCPITQTEADGKVPFIVMRGCGCVLSHRGYVELAKGEARNTCVVCEASLPAKYRGEATAEDPLVDEELAYITLCGNAATVEALRRVMERKRVLEAERRDKKKDKKDKKDKKEKRGSEESVEGERKRVKGPERKDGPTSVTSLATQAILAEAAENVRKMHEQSSTYSALFRKE